MRTTAISLLLGLMLVQEQQPVPRFRSGVDVILLDVTVLDADRKPARGLKADDFTILEDGKPQPLVSFDEVDSPEPDGSLVPWMREVPPDVRTNYGDDRRLVVLVMDDANIGFRDREHVKTIGRNIVEQLGPSDQAAVVYTGNNQKSQEFTSNRKLLRAAVERFAETAIPGGPADSDGQAEVAQSYAIGTIDRTIETLIAIPHRRKALILVSSLAINMQSSAGGSDLSYLLRLAVQRAQRANVTVYPVNPAGLAIDIGEGTNRDLAGETARFIANGTGGFAVVNRNEFAPQIKQIFRETGSYYLIGFQSAHRDGKTRRLEIKMNRPGLTARTRSSYDAPSDKKERKADKTLPLIRALSSVLPSSEVPMRVVLAPFSAPGSRDFVTVTLGLHQPVPRDLDGATERVQLISTAINMGHRQVQTFTQTVQMTLRHTPDGDDAKYEVLSKLELPPGRYNLRFAAHSSLRAKTGSVFEEIEIPDFNREALSMSGVVVSVTPALPAAPKNFLASVVPLQPTTQRVFMQGHKPSAFLRVYQGGKKARVPIVLTTSIVDEQDRTVLTAKDTLDAARFTGDAGVEHHFALPVERLTPGAYLLRFEATGGGKPATREVRFVIR